MLKANPFFARIWVRASVHAPEQDWPVPSRVQAQFTQGMLSVQHEADEQRDISKQQLELFMRNPERLVRFNTALHDACVALEQTMHPLPQEGLAFASNADLWSYFDRHEQAHSHCARLGWTSVFAEQACEACSGAIRDLIDQRLPLGMDRGRALSLLLTTDRPTVAEQHQRDVLELAQVVQQDPNWVQSSDLLAQAPMEWANRAQTVNTKTCFVGVLDGEPIHSLAQTVKDIHRCAHSISDVQQHLREADAKRVQDLLDRETLIGALGMTSNERAFVDAYRDALWLKAYRRYVQQYALYRLEPILEDIARRLHVDIDVVRYLLPEEIQSYLLHQQPIPVNAHERVQGCRYIVDQAGHRFEIPPRRVQVEPQKTTTTSNPMQLRGMTASRGYATGKVYIVRHVSDIADMPDKAILIINQARPEYTSAFARAAAVVCDQGGVTSHAAIIAREYGVPCVVATRRASELFTRGMLVEVDANRAEIRLLC